MLDLVLVRVGKTGSSSLSKALTEHYGSTATQFDQSQDFGKTALREHHRNSGAARLRAETRFVHGHLRAADYEGVPSRLKITFLRDPITRLVSHHSYWLSDALEATEPERDRLREHNLSLAEFAASPRVRQLYTEHYFGGVDMKMFDFIGCFERFDEDYERALSLAGANAPVRHDLPNPNPNYAARKAELKDAALAAELRRLLADEYEFYHRWTERHR